MIETNEFQTQITEELLSSLNKEIREQLLEYVTTIPFIKGLISKNRKRAKDLPRDKKGRIIIDLMNPHICEDMDYFRPMALMFKKHGKYTNLKPNKNPNSEYYKLVTRERDRCRYGYVRESDGEWVTGPMYFYLNYCPIEQTKIIEGTKTGSRIIDFPEFWEGIYWRFHYMEQARFGGMYNDFQGGQFGVELASRGKSKSYSAAAMLARNIFVGESKDSCKNVTSLITASKSEYLTSDGTLNKFYYVFNFVRTYGFFPKRYIRNSMNAMNWEMGWEDTKKQIIKGSRNSVLGVTTGGDIGKLRGKRVIYLGIEEFGSFKNLIQVINTLSPNVKESEYAFGLLYAFGCVCKGTKVLNENGKLCNIEDIKIGDKLLSYDGNHAVIENVSWKQPIGYKECVRIETEKNNFIECSIDHPLLTLNKDNCGYHSVGTCSFYRANELKVGDTLLMPKNIDVFGNINEPDAYLLGMLFGNGNYSKKTPTVTLSICSNEEYDFINENYNVGISKLYVNVDNKVYSQLYFKEKKIKNLLIKYKMYGQVFEQKQLPYNINNWDKESLCAFLGGYFNADGNIQIVKKKYRSIKLSCIYENTLLQIKQLLYKLGISSYIYKEDKSGSILHSNVNKKDYQMNSTVLYVLYISNSVDVQTFKQNIKFIIKNKQERLDTFTLTFKRGYYNNLKFVLKDNKKGEWFINRTFNNLQAVTIKKITSLGIKEIYNLTANTTHTYLTNGFLSANTAGDQESDFAGAREIYCNPSGYGMYALPDVYNQEGKNRKEIGFFFPAYINRKGYYNNNGISDVIGALISILKNRYEKKYNSTDETTIIKTIAEEPIFPEEAMMRTTLNLFPTTALNERINQIDSDPHIFDNVYIGKLVIDSSKKISYKLTADTPIRIFPTKDNKIHGAEEFYAMPEIDKNTGKVFSNRYIVANDPFDDDTSSTMSLGCIFVLDLFKDEIVYEYTGRPDFADELFEKARLVTMFYNATLLYENNKKGLFSYFQRMRCTHLLAPVPEYLKNKDLVKSIGYGNTAYGVNATKGVNAHARTLIRDWLLEPVTVVNENNESVEVSRLYTIKNRALLVELATWDTIRNFDRVSALGILMIFRADRLALAGGSVKNLLIQNVKKKSDDDFFIRNYDNKYK